MLPGYDALIDRYQSTAHAPHPMLAALYLPSDFLSEHQLLADRANDFLRLPENTSANRSHKESSPRLFGRGWNRQPRLIPCC
jgi:hypothetical protein